MKHLGDVTKIKGNKVEPVEFITFGAPCQDLSIAGKRKGMKHTSNGDDETTRSGLFFEAIRIIKEMRENDRASGRTDEFIRPRFCLYENVPGAFSSNKGEDFRIVLEETAKIADPEISIPRPPQGKWTNAGCIMGRGYSIAWRTLDAQYFGVPQRRRRIALVADFGGESAPEILFKQDCLPWHFEPGRTERETAPSDAERGADTAISFQERAGCAGGAKASSSSPTEREHSQPLTISECYKATTINGDDITPTLVSGQYKQSENTQDGLSIVYGISAYESNSMKSDNPHSGIYEADTSRTLDNNGGNSACNQGGMIVLEGNGSRPSHLGDGYAESDVMYTLNATEQHAVYSIENHPNDSRCRIDPNGKVQSLSSRMGTGGNNTPMALMIGNYNQGKNAKYNFSVEEEKIGAQTAKGPGAVCQSVVRRLTPLECTRLQSYPDGWVDIGDWTDSKGKKHKDADSPKYKALGNSIAVCCWRFILRNINEYCTEHTIASLFDGIGGFPLIWEELNGSKSCRWVSEIEEFPIAVTKIRFEQE